ncbi:S41 family peptidase [Paenibacillus sp. TRM 82003]|nr:S41 family peptidase [Paenibacillus sp. TRM 82003]
MKRTQQLRLWKRWALALTSAAVMLTPWPAYAEEATALEPLDEVIEKLEDLHYSGLTAEELRDTTIDGVLQDLNDPYTDYYDPNEWRKLQDEFEQTYVGIGIRFTKMEQGLRILRVYSDSAAEAAGLRAGDAVVRVADKAVADYTLDELAGDLLGPEGSEVKLTIVDASGADRIVTIARKSFRVPTVESRLLDDGAGYIQITSFSSETPTLVAGALNSFRGEEAFRSLLIDLRGNPGGYLHSVAETAALFVEEGPILFAKDRDGNEAILSVEDGGKVTVPVAILVDGGSASASEVFAGAMQDYDLATIVGAKTFGKGSVQQLVELEAGGGLKVTVEHYFTPDRHPVNGVGITPDVRAATWLDQILTALRETGSDKVRVEFDAHETVVNGQPFEDVVAVVRENGRTYVRSVALADLLDSEAAWDGASSSIRIKTPESSASFDPHSGLLLKDGVSFIDVTAFAKAFDGIKVFTTTTKVALELR